MKDVKSFGIRCNGLSEETKNFGKGPVQNLEAMLERDLGPLDILERYCKEFKEHSHITSDVLGAFLTYLLTHPNQMLYYISLFSSLTYLPT